MDGIILMVPVASIFEVDDFAISIVSTLAVDLSYGPCKWVLWKGLSGNLEILMMYYLIIVETEFEW